MGKDKWIQKAIRKPGAFTRQAEAHGMTVSEYADAVLSGKVKAGKTTKRRATLAKTLKSLARKRKVK